MERNFSLDILKLCLAFMVVGLHAGFLNDFSAAGHFLTVHGVFRIAVPLFFVINGYYFSSIANISELAKWVKKITLLYVFWMLCYSYFWFDFERNGVVFTINTMMLGYNHLWYLPAMVGAGILTFLFRNNLGKAACFAFVAFLTGVLIQYMGNYHIIENEFFDMLLNKINFHRNFLFFGFPFFFIGFYIRHTEYNASFSRLILIVISGFVLLLLESYYNYSNPFNDGGFDNLLSLAIICPAIFLVILKMPFKSENKKLAFVSSGVYFVHLSFLIILRDVFMSGYQGTTLTILCILISVLASFVLIKVRDKTRWSFIL
ncbi:acyltransferase family protein [Vibrio sp. TH_r3]|uniref:acyltransferase family protein n=1 Tax=Vibrio sp. TH_r3 TaxID=3082084 RepID=UPI0029535731|nr:acyltransferase family protein [Vibrio sp. TH_r3]MDV7104658.1 acyltransferase family protein [Vibrio sp. TH_r3]